MSPPKLPSDAAALALLVEELRLHQVELELQNTELRQLEADNRQHRDRYAELFASAPVGYCTLDADGGIQDFNRAAELMFDSVPLASGRKLLGLVDPSEAAGLKQMLESARQDAIIGFDFNLVGSPQVWIHIAARPARPSVAAPTDAVLVTFTDISTRVLLQQRLQEYARRAVTQQETERRRVARDLHDGVNQILAALRLHLAAAGPPQEAIELVDTAIEEVRRVSHRLHPLILADLGLEAALQSLCRQFSGLSGAHAHLQIETGLPRLEVELEITIFRFVQEALVNAVTHGGAEHISVDLRAAANLLVLKIDDDGCGFDPLLPSTGFGLASLREHTDLLGGSLSLESSVGHGTQIRIELPLRIVTPDPAVTDD